MNKSIKALKSISFFLIFSLLNTSLLANENLEKKVQQLEQLLQLYLEENISLKQQLKFLSVEQGNESNCSLSNPSKCEDDYLCKIISSSEITYVPYVEEAWRRELSCIYSKLDTEQFTNYFIRLPRSERLKIQDQLRNYGFLDVIVDGRWNNLTWEAIKNFVQETKIVVFTPRNVFLEIKEKSITTASENENYEPSTSDDGLTSQLLLNRAFQTVDEAITSNDEKIKELSLTSKDGVLFKTVDEAITSNDAGLQKSLTEVIPNKAEQKTPTKHSKNQSGFINTFTLTKVGNNLRLSDKSLKVKAKFDTEFSDGNQLFLKDNKGAEIRLMKPANRSGRLGLFQTKCVTQICDISGYLEMRYVYGTPEISFVFEDFTEFTENTSAFSITDLRRKSRSIEVEIYGFARYQDNINEFSLSEHYQLLSADRLTVNLSKMTTEELEKYISECFGKCDQLKVKGKLLFPGGELIAEKITKY